jgi:hypothetical protein
MIENEEGLEQIRRQLENMEDVVTNLKRRADVIHALQLCLQLEVPVEMVYQLRRHIDDYLGIPEARSLLHAAQVPNAAHVPSH